MKTSVLEYVSIESGLWRREPQENAVVRRQCEGDAARRRPVVTARPHVPHR